MNLKELAVKLGSTRIDNLESIAQGIRSVSLEKYAKILSLEIVRQKLLNSRLSHDVDSSGDFPYLINQECGNGVIVGVSPMLIIPNTNRESLKRYASELRSKINGYSGIIHFLPFLMNGENVRSRLSEGIPIAFVNLAYDEKSLERRFRQYART